MSTQVVVRNSLPSMPLPDGTVNAIRGDNYGAQRVIESNDRNALAREGCYFHSISETGDTGVELVADNQTAFSATAPAIIWVNTSATKYAYIDYARFFCITNAGAGLASLECLAATDTTNRYDSGGTAQTVYKSFAGAPQSSEVTMYLATSQALAASAASANVSYVGRTILTSVITALKSVYTVAFGAPHTNVTGAVSVGGYQVHTMAPFIIPPGGSGLLYLWAPSMSDCPDLITDTGWFEK